LLSGPPKLFPPREVEVPVGCVRMGGRSRLSSQSATLAAMWHSLSNEVVHHGPDLAYGEISACQGTLVVERQPDRHNSFGVAPYPLPPNVDSLEARQRWACSHILREEELRPNITLCRFLGGHRARSTCQGTQPEMPASFRSSSQNGMCSTAQCWTSLKRVNVGYSQRSSQR
jgi:hypothetical protein